MNETPTIREALEDAEAATGFSRASVAMVVTNPNLRDNPIVYVNEAFERMTGYSRSAAVGRNCRFLQGEGTDRGAIAAISDAVENHEQIAVDLLNYRANGEPFMNRLIIAPILGEDGRCIYFVAIQKELHDQDRAAQSDTVDRQMEEIQHRVKNHLSMIIGMIREKSRNTSAPEEFGTLSRRIECLQLLYEEMALSTGDNRDVMPVGTYLARVANAIAHLEGRAGIRCSISIERVDAPVEVATRLGLALTEVLTNAFKHAFVGLDRGQIDVRMTTLSEGGLRLTITDDGIGIPKTIDWPSTGSLGGQIVDGLIEGLDGTLVLGRGAAGTVVTIDVPVGAAARD